MSVCIYSALVVFMFKFSHFLKRPAIEKLERVIPTNNPLILPLPRIRHEVLLILSEPHACYRIVVNVPEVLDHLLALEGPETHVPVVMSTRYQRLCPRDAHIKYLTSAHILKAIATTKYYRLRVHASFDLPVSNSSITAASYSSLISIREKAGIYVICVSLECMERPHRLDAPQNGFPLEGCPQDELVVD